MTSLSNGPPVETFDEPGGVEEWLTEEELAEELEQVDDWFAELWEIREELKDIRDYAISISRDPVGYLGGCLTAASVSVSKYWRLPAFRQFVSEIAETSYPLGTSQLGLYSLLVGGPGHGKTTIISEAIYTLRQSGGEFYKEWPSTAAGFISNFLVRKEELDDLQHQYPGKTFGKYFDEVLFENDEGFAIKYLQGRDENNDDLLLLYRKAWFGNVALKYGGSRRGESYHYLPQFQSALAALVGVHPKHAHLVWGDEEVGDRQRWIVWRCRNLPIDLTHLDEGKPPIPQFNLHPDWRLEAEDDEFASMEKLYYIIPRDDAYALEDAYFHNYRLGVKDGIPQEFLDIAEHQNGEHWLASRNKLAAAFCILLGDPPYLTLEHKRNGGNSVKNQPPTNNLDRTNIQKKNKARNGS